MTSMLDIAGGIVIGGTILGLFYLGFVAALSALHPDTDELVPVGGWAAMIVAVAAGLWLVFRHGLSGL
jgi:hypothetical protein